MSAQFPFNDLHSYKDYVVFVRMCAPDEFPNREGMLAEDQWTLDLAFQGLREGLASAVEEKGNRPEFAECARLISTASEHYAAGDRRGGFRALDEAHKKLKRIPSR